MEDPYYLEIFMAVPYHLEDSMVVLFLLEVFTVGPACLEDSMEVP
jgi:hypothetical protein